MFDSIKSSIRARRQPKRPQSELPRMRDDTAAFARQDRLDRLDAVKGVFDKIRRTGSLKEIRLPPIQRSKPLTFSNLFASSNAAGGQPMNTLAEDGGASEAGASVIKRKPLPADELPFSLSDEPSFDPQAPRTDPSMYRLAKSVLKHRYTTKFEMDFEPPVGVSKQAYHFLWATEDQLNDKVMDDIVWVRERFAQARQSEPDDDAVIFWYMEDDAL